MTIGYGTEPYGMVPFGDGPATPSVFIEIDFSGTAWDSPDDATWTDVSEYAQAINPQRGRGNEIGSVEAGTMSLTLDNSDGRFTPALSTSPYFPYVKPRRPVRAYAVYQGTTYPLFRGVTGRFPATTAAGVTNVTISAVDVTTPLSKKTLQNPFVYEVTSGGYSLFELWKMDDGPSRFSGTLDPVGNYITPVPSTTNVPISRGGGGTPTVQAGDSDILPNTAGLGSAGVSGTTEATVNGLNGPGTHVITSSGTAFVTTPFPLDIATDGGDFTISMWYQMDASPQGGDYPYGLVFKLENADTKRSHMEIFCSIATYFFGYYTNPGAPSGNDRGFFSDGLLDNPSFDPPAFGEPALIQVKYKHNGGTGGNPAICLSVNGYDLNWTDIEGTAFFKAGNYRLVIGSLLGPNTDPITTQSLVGSDFHVEMVSVHNEALSSLDAARLLLAAGGHDNNSPALRIGYLLDQLGWPDSMRNIDPTDDGSRMLFLNWEGTPETLDELRAPALDTNGLLFVSPDGKVTYQSRRHRVNPSPRFLFDEDAGTGAEGPLEWEMSEDAITNVANVDNAYGVKVTLKNDASAAEFGETSVNLTTRLKNDEEAIQAGYWRINRFGDAQLRLDAVTLNPAAQANGDLWESVLSLELSDCIGLRNLPDKAPDQVTDYFVEHISHEIARDGDRLTWVTTLQVSPATNREAWILGDPVLGVLGSTTILHY